MKLTKSNVVFDEFTHTYTLDDKELGGVTSLLGRHMFADKYDGIPDSVLARAAEYGTKVHHDLELFDTLGIDDEPIVADYKLLVDGLEHIDSEYLVTDGEHLASKIDKVFSADGTTAILADIKTTSKLDKYYVSWQLSIYSYLFRLMNPDIQVTKLYAIWLPKPQYGKPELVEVEAQSDEEVKALLEADIKGEKYTPEHMPVVKDADTGLPTIAAEYWDFVIDLERQAKEIDEARKEMKAKLLAAMQEFDVKKVDFETISVTRKLASTSARVDSKLLMEKYPDIYTEVTKTINVSESLLIKLK